MVVVLLALLVVGGIVALVIWQPWRSWLDAAASGPSPAPASSSAPASPTASSGSASPSATSAPAEPDPESSDPADAEGDEPEVLPCTTSDVTVSAIADKSAYGTGELPKLSIQLVNDTEFPCLMNVGTTAQAFEITSGSDTWWRSTDCQSEPSDQVVQLNGGQTVTSAEPLVWDRTRSSADDCDGQRQSALPGWYNLTVSIGGIESVEPAQFTLR
nr:hypothetical protein [Microbacterium marinum]